MSQIGGYQQILASSEIDASARRWMSEIMWGIVDEDGRDYRPTMVTIKCLVARSPHGSTSIEHPVHDARPRRFFSMGCVKSCDEEITWNSTAMQRGEKWCKPAGKPWQERIAR